jgi:iron complex transport system substrate-binding protein
MVVVQKDEKGNSRSRKCKYQKIWEAEIRKKMKTKNKILASLEIAIVLCSVFLVAIPAIAGDQTTQKASASTITTASKDDYVLGVYGNANEDDTIDMRDLTYVKLIFFGKKPETELADAKYDGEINPLDFIQIKLIIVGKEKELTYVDVCGEAETVHKPIKRIADLSAGFATEVMRALDAEDTIVGVSNSIKKKPVFFPELSKLPLIAGSWYTPDYEAILGQNPDAVITYIPWAKNWVLKKNKWKEKLPGVQIISLGFVNPTGAEYTGAAGVGKHSGILENTRKLGYILDKEDEAKEFCDWYEGWLSKVKERTDGLSEHEKPRVYTEWHQDYRFLKGRHHQICILAGGIDLLDDLPTTSGYVDPEWVIEQNPDIIIIAHSAGLSYGTDDPSGMKAIRDGVLNRPELANVAAVKNDRVYVGIALTNGPRTIVAITYHGKWYHPELFDDLDPKAIHQEYIDRFCHIDFSVYEHGVFVYPEPS